MSILEDYESISEQYAIASWLPLTGRLTPISLKIGAPEKRKECLGTMELNIGGELSRLLPSLRLSSRPGSAAAASPVVYCDPPPEVAKTVVGVAEKKRPRPFLLDPVSCPGRSLSPWVQCSSPL